MRRECKTFFILAISMGLNLNRLEPAPCRCKVVKMQFEGKRAKYIFKVDSDLFELYKKIIADFI